MALLLHHPDGMIRIEETANGKRRVNVDLRDHSRFMQFPTCETTYSDDLIRAIPDVKGPAYLCDEILRDVDPRYIEHHLVTTLFSHVERHAFQGKRLLDFGCGSGASTMVFTRQLPNTEIIGIDLDERLLGIARLRASHSDARHVTFLASPSGDRLPPGIGMFDFIVLPAVYEHLLPSERDRLIPLLWNVLKPGGVLFIDETPHRWFPVESHTTGLPLINYLPAFLALPYARFVSKRGLRHDDWPTLLRKGIRGATTSEILRRIRCAGGEPELLTPIAAHVKTPVDVWFEGYARHATGRSGQIKRALHGALNIIYTITGIAFVPYLSLAIRKRG